MPGFYDILVVGDYCLDLIFSGLPALPVLGQETFSRGFRMLPGGSYNTAVAMHRLGLRVGWAGDFGNDDFSRFVLDCARSEGLDERLFVHHPKSLRRVTVAASTLQDRAFVTYFDPGPIIPAGMKTILKQSARVFFVPGLYYGRWFEIGMRLAKAKGMALVMDGNSSVETLQNTPSLQKVLPNIDLFLPNAKEACRMTGQREIEPALLTLAGICPLVVIKAGAEGAYAARGGKVINSPAIPVAPIETTGAGDCFDAGFIRAWLQGCQIDECLRWGNIVGGLSTLAEGGTGKTIYEEEVIEWLNR
jgi:sugar/nucleoside kinase (ribokinase family)